MWVAVVLACITQLATSCKVIANTEELFYNELVCKNDASNMVNFLSTKGVFAVPICFKVGESV